MGMQFTKNRVFSAPFSAMISVTNKCNLACKYCCNNSTIDYTDDMSRDEILDVLKQFSEMKILSFISLAERCSFVRMYLFF